MYKNNQRVKSGEKKLFKYCSLEGVVYLNGGSSCRWSLKWHSLCVGLQYVDP